MTDFSQTLMAKLQNYNQKHKTQAKLEDLKDTDEVWQHANKQFRLKKQETQDMYNKLKKDTCFDTIYSNRVRVYQQQSRAADTDGFASLSLCQSEEGSNKNRSKINPLIHKPAGQMLFFKTPLQSKHKGTIEK